jgi:molecular chaperone DnaK
VSISAPVRVRLRYPDLDTFVERFAPNVTRGGVFIASRAPRPVGDTFPFEVQLASGHVALAGEGKVIWIKEYNPAEPTKPHGMGVQFTSLAPASREVLQRLLKAKDALRGPNAPRGFTAPHATLQSRQNGAGRPRVDTSVDLAAEFGLDDAVLRRALDRAWVGAKPAEEELQGLLASEAPEPKATLPLALKELRRMLDPTARRRTTTGRLQTLESAAAAAIAEKAAPPLVAPSPPTNGVSHAHDE